MAQGRHSFIQNVILTALNNISIIKKHMNFGFTYDDIIFFQSMQIREMMAGAQRQIQERKAQIAVSDISIVLHT